VASKPLAPLASKAQVLPKAAVANLQPSPTKTLVAQCLDQQPSSPSTPLSPQLAVSPKASEDHGSRKASAADEMNLGKVSDMVDTVKVSDETLVSLEAAPEQPIPKGQGKGKGKGVPPPPPPKAKAKAVPKAKGESDAPAFRRASSLGPSHNGRQLYWRAVAGAAEVKQSIFDRSAEGGEEVKGLTAGFAWDEFNTLFGAPTAPEEAKVAAGDSVIARDRRKSMPDLFRKEGAIESVPPVSILSKQQATSCSIILYKFKHGLDDPSNHLCQLQLERLGEDTVGRLRELVDIVEDAQVQELRKFSKQNASSANGIGVPNMRSVERQLLPLFDVDRVDARVRLATIYCTLQARRHHILSVAAALTNAAKEARSSRALKDLINAALALRDYVLHGPEALNDPGDQAQVMDIGSLISGMREFKAVGPDSNKISLLHFFARSLMRTNNEFDAELIRQLPGLTDGKTVTAQNTPWPELQDGLAQFAADAKFAAGELENHKGMYSGSSITVLTDLVERFADVANEAKRAIADAASVLEDLGRYFGVPGAANKASTSKKNPSGLHVVCQLADLIAGFRRACAVVRAQQQQSAKTSVRTRSVSVSRRHSVL
jgi:hypothetical protein